MTENKCPKCKEREEIADHYYAELARLRQTNQNLIGFVEMFICPFCKNGDESSCLDNDRSVRFCKTAKGLVASAAPKKHNIELQLPKEATEWVSTHQKG